MLVSKFINALEKAIQTARQHKVWVVMLVPSGWKHKNTLMNLLAGYGSLYGHTLLLKGGGKVSCFTFSKEVLDEGIRSMVIAPEQRLTPIDEIGAAAWEKATQPIGETTW